MCCILIALLRRCNAIVNDTYCKIHGVRAHWLESIPGGLGIGGVKQSLFSVFVFSVPVEYEESGVRDDKDPCNAMI